MDYNEHIQYISKTIFLNSQGTFLLSFRPIFYQDGSFLPPEEARISSDPDLYPPHHGGRPVPGVVLDQ